MCSRGDIIQVKVLGAMALIGEGKFSVFIESLTIQQQSVGFCTDAR